MSAHLHKGHNDPAEESSQKQPLGLKIELVCIIRTLVNSVMHNIIITVEDILLYLTVPMNADFLCKRRILPSCHQQSNRMSRESVKLHTLVSRREDFKQLIIKNELFVA